MIRPVDMVNMVSVCSFANSRKDISKIKCTPPQALTPVPKVVSVKATQILTQMPNVNFTASLYQEEFPANEALIANLPETEQRLNRIALSAEYDIADGNFLAAIKKKLCMANICRSEGRKGEAQAIVDSVVPLFKKLIIPKV